MDPLRGAIDQWAPFMASPPGPTCTDYKPTIDVLGVRGGNRLKAQRVYQTLQRVKLYYEGYLDYEGAAGVTRVYWSFFNMCER